MVSPRIRNLVKSRFTRGQISVLVALCLTIVYLHRRDPALLLLQQRQRRTRFRVVGPSSSSSSVLQSTSDISFQFFTRSEQRQFLDDFGYYCQKGFYKKRDENLLLTSFDRLPDVYGTELWKYCALYTGYGNVWYDPENSKSLIDFQDMLSKENVAVRVDKKVHHSFLQMEKPKSKVCVNMMRLFIESRQLHPMRISEVLGLYIDADKQEWTMLEARCLWAGDVVVDTILTEQRPPMAHCPVMNAFCCQVWREQDTFASMVLKDPYLVPHSLGPNPRPFVDTEDEKFLGIPSKDLAYIATVREVRTGLDPAVVPNFFDLLAENDCLPAGRDCFRCLHDAGEDHHGCQCKKECPCYCHTLCHIRPPPKPITAEWLVQPPLYRKDPKRLIPKIIHQTWYEPITKEKYPNMSRLIESFRRSGWEYVFYDDESASNFLSTHFPPAVREAYDAIIPGAFKADLFRLCVLLIRGGLYADMDVILESNLDELIDDSVGFMTAQDEPGIGVDHRSCLWNGLMASTPGHPFLMRTIELVVNNARNRFTSVDYDNMLCPEPVLTVSHSLDMLFTAGPCILGSAINDVLRRHMQQTFEAGEVDLFESAGEVEPNDPRLSIPGRTIILQQNKNDMGSHRFTYVEKNTVVAATDLPESDDREKTLVHYSKTRSRFGIYGLSKLYTNDQRANEEIRIRYA